MNINFTDLEKLIKLAERSNINALEVTDGDKRIAIVCQSNKDDTGLANSKSNADASNSQREMPTKADSEKNNNEGATEDTNSQAPMHITAPMLGTFYRRSEPSADEFVQVGASVDKGQTLCIIEAMKMMHEVKADYACTIKEVLIEEGDVVEYGQPLFVIEADS